MFTASHEILDKLCIINSFFIKRDELIFLGLRGCLPLNEDDCSFQKKIHLVAAELDYLHLRCTFLQWQPSTGLIAAFAGSTVPNRKYVQNALLNEGRGTNQLMTGLFNNYQKGRHKYNSPTGHEAFRQDNKLPVRRTADDLDYDEEDRVEFVRPFDNIHASWCPGLSHASYASAGCQVIMGYPKCAKRGDDSENTGPWSEFHKNAYDLEQNKFTYILLNGRDAQRLSLQPQGNFKPRLRYGSIGPLVGIVQKALKDRNHYEGQIDNDFGPKTLFAILNYQTTAFGADGDDGIVGPITAKALNIELVI